LVRETVEPPTPTLRVISSSLAPASATNRICALQFARHLLAATEQGPKLIAFRLAQLDPLPYIHSDLLEGETRRIER
jgi:hypothetical protein